MKCAGCGREIKTVGDGISFGSSVSYFGGNVCCDCHKNKIVSYKELVWCLSLSDKTIAEIICGDNLACKVVRNTLKQNKVSYSQLREDVKKWKKIRKQQELIDDAVIVYHLQKADYSALD